MDTFTVNLNTEIDRIVSALIQNAVNSFATAFANDTQGQLTREDIIGEWNANSNIKVVAAEVEPSQPKTRTKTDRNRKCQVPKTKGKTPGAPCNKSCVVDEEYCPEHLKKMGTETKTEHKEAKVEAKVETKSKVLTDEERAQGCPHTLESGINKGKLCGKKPSKDSKYCSVHAKKH